MTSFIASRAVLLIAPAVLLLAACADPNASACDTANRDINLGTLIENSATGAYAQCVSDLQAELASLQLQARVLDAEASRLNAEAAALDGERRAAAQRLAALNESQAELMRQISSQGPGSGASDAQIQSLVDSEARLRSEIATQNSAGGVDSATANDLLQQQRELDALALQIL